MVEFITVFVAALAVLFAYLWRRSVRSARGRQQLWHNALKSLAARDYDGTKAWVAMLEGPAGQVSGNEPASLAVALRETAEALAAGAREQEAAYRELEDVLSSLQDAVLVVDGESRLRFLNASALQFFDVRIEDVLGAQLLEALPSFGLESAVRAALHAGHSTMRDVSLYALPGHPTAAAGSTRREVFLRVAPVRHSDATVSGAVAIVQDLTEVRHLERVRREFVANASHELRTPIANIRAAAETILNDPHDTDLTARFLPHVVGEAERLSRLVSDLLDLARAESSEETWHAPVDLAAITTSVVQQLRDKAANNGITVRFECDEHDNEHTGPEVRVPGDAAGLEQVVFNLLDNALIYTPRGGIVTLCLGRQHFPSAVPLSTANTAQSANAPQSLAQSTHTQAAKAAMQSPEHTPSIHAIPVQTVTLQVSDNGMGIPPDDLPRIFERFYRVDKARSRAQGGTGLGLAIVKHIVENHNGHIKVESEPGRGTTFTVTLPAF